MILFIINLLGKINKLSENVDIQKDSVFDNEKLIYAISAGVVLVLIGLAFVLAKPENLWDKILDFFNSLTLAEVPGTRLFGSENGLYLPAPINPAAHYVFYTAIFQFCLGLGLYQIVLFFIRFKIKSSINKIAETLGNLIFWLGSSYLVIRFLNHTSTINDWWIFWAGVLVVLGLSFLARGLILYSSKNRVVNQVSTKVL